MSISAVVVNYRRYDLLRTCIESLVQATQPPDEIVVIDNASVPSQAEAIRTRFPDATVISNARNVGFASACNQGWRTTSGDLVLFLNPDVSLDADCLTRCVEAAMSDDQIGIVTCRLVR